MITRAPEYEMMLRIYVVPLYGCLINTLITPTSSIHSLLQTVLGLCHLTLYNPYEVSFRYRVPIEECFALTIS